MAGAETFMKRYDVLWADLDPVRGAEIAKTRPVVVVSLDELNAALETVTVCPLTSQLHHGRRSRVQMDCAGKPAEIAVDQIRTISKKRLGRTICSLTENEASTLRCVIMEMFCEP